MPKPLVLLIEDDCHLCDTISDLLELLDINYRVACGNMTSRSELIRMKPDLVLLDTPLRGRSSLDIITDIRVDLRLRYTKLVVIAADEYTNAPECRLADAVLVKPFAVGELETALRRLLYNGRRPEAAVRGMELTRQASATLGK